MVSRSRKSVTTKRQSHLDETTRKQLERGTRVTELMKQKQYSPLSVAQMGLSLYAVNEGYLDGVEVAKVGDYEAALHDYARTYNGDLLEDLSIGDRDPGW